MSCRQFLRDLEQHWDRHAGEVAPRLPRDLAGHAERCRRCAGRLREAQAARALLFCLRPVGSAAPGEPAAAGSDSGRFLAGVRRQIARAGEKSVWIPWPIKARDLAVAGGIFALTLASFVYNVRRTETPDISEAEALDVPHVHWQHPSDDHQAGATDVFLSLLNP